MLNKKSLMGTLCGVAACCVLTLSGCGSDPDSAPAGMKLVEEGTLTVATSADYEPFEYVEDGEYKGFDLDLARALAEKLDLKIKIENVDFDAVTAGVASGVKYDCGVAALSESPKRAKEVGFTDPYYMDDQSIVVKGDDASVTKENALDVLNGADVKIAAQSGSTSESFAKENCPDAKVVAYKNAVDMFAALQSGQVNALVVNRSVAAQMISGSFSSLKVVKEVSTGEEYSVIYDLENPELGDKLNDALAELVKDGTVDELMDKYSIK